MDTYTYAQHIVNTGHAHGNMQDTMEVIQLAKKGGHMNSIEKFHMYCIYKQNNQTNEVLFNQKHPIFDAVCNLYVNQWHIKCTISHTTR